MTQEDLDRITKQDTFNAIMGSYGQVASVVFAATNYIIARQAGAPTMEMLFDELARAVAELPLNESVGRGAKDARH